MSDSISADKTSMIPLRFKNVSQVYKSFMPFLSNGGLFVPTAKSYQLGDEVTLVIKLPANDEKFKLLGHVAWISPAAAMGDKKQGVGIQFIDGNGVAMRHRIEDLLGDRLDSDDSTYTM